jgi:hypothetical protein
MQFITGPDQANSVDKGFSWVCSQACRLSAAPLSAFHRLALTGMPKWYYQHHRLGMETLRQALPSSELVRSEPEEATLDIDEAPFQRAVRAACQSLSDVSCPDSWSQHCTFIDHLRLAAELYLERSGYVAHDELNTFEALIEARFLGHEVQNYYAKLLCLFRNRGFPHLHSSLHVFQDEAAQRELPLTDRLALLYVAIDAADATLKGPDGYRYYNSARGAFNYDFDPHRDGSNIPSVLFHIPSKNAQEELKKVACIRLGTPTRQVDGHLPNSSTAEIIPEFRAFLELYRSQGKSHLYVNLQNSQMRSLHSDESKRCEAIAGLEEAYPDNFIYVGLSKDSNFYWQRGEYKEGVHFKVLQDLIMGQLKNADSDAPIISTLQQSPIIEGRVSSLLEQSWQDACGGTSVLDPRSYARFLKALPSAFLKGLYQLVEEHEESLGLLIIPKAPNEAPLSFKQLQASLLAALQDAKTLSPQLYSEELKTFAEQELARIEREELIDTEELGLRQVQQIHRTFFTALSQELQRSDEALMGCLIFDPSKPLLASPTGVLREGDLATDLFIGNFLHVLMDCPDSGYVLPPWAKTPEMRAAVQKLLCDIWTDAFAGQACLSPEERHIFIELAYTRIIRFFIQVSGCDSFNASCKDCIDRGASTLALLMGYDMLIHGLWSDQAAQDHLMMVALVPALLVRQRPINAHRLESAMSALEWISRNEEVSRALRQREAQAALAAIQIPTPPAQELGISPREARTFAEYWDSLAQAPLFYTPEPLPDLAHTLLADPNLDLRLEIPTEGDESRPIYAHFAEGIRNKIISINGTLFDGSHERDPVALAIEELEESGVKAEEALRLCKLGSERVQEPLNEILSENLGNPFLQIRPRLAQIKGHAPFNIDIHASAIAQELRFTAVYQLECTHPQAEAPGRLNLNSSALVLAQIDIKLDKLTKTKATFRSLDALEAVKCMEGFGNGNTETIDLCWELMAGSSECLDTSIET